MQDSEQPSWAVGDKVTHPHFRDTGEIIELQHEGRTAIVSVDRLVEYIETIDGKVESVEIVSASDEKTILKIVKHLPDVHTVAAADLERVK